MRTKWLSLLLIIALSATLLSVSANASSNSNWTLVWSDEFTAPAGSPVDSTKWVFDTGGGGWGNSELQNYTDRTDNASISNNKLIIQAKKENYGNSQYTSARIKTKNKFSVKYGKIEMRAMLPYGQGIWPAFWMLGANIDTVGWPNNGEIDIMENVGPKSQDRIIGTAHGPGYSGGNAVSNSYTLTDYSNTYHTYAVEFEPSVIRWYVDGNLYHQVTPSDVLNKQWVFDQDFYIILNLAVGGSWPGSPDATTKFPQKFYIDYVKVWQRTGTYDIVALKAVNNGKYVTASNAGSDSLIASKTSVGTWEKFEKIDLGSGKIALRSLVNSKYVTADPNGTNALIASSDTIGTNQTFVVSTAPDGKLNLLALANNKYVSADNNGVSPLIANRTAPANWEKFEIVTQ
ncbi:MAG: glycoside hydrolase family 16 protein [Candidatus Cohnella colombiensis]|uniref:Glycoside hydrolase family 16 protein n=1 Tax=Candidatus Cohnella colombiensis TaxID=3121368 RepID=A0AA95EY54_9BACL|nr:MAG: glycoside hydrolase family 16 protein [Cohnella sp.]